MTISVGFIGAGMMASSLMDGLLSKGVVSSPDNISCSDVWEAARMRASKQGYHVANSNMDVCHRATDVVILAVKPHTITAVCENVRDVTSNAVVISIAAGIPLKVLEEHLPGRRIIRVMPNTPCLVGEAASGFCMGTHTNEKDRELVLSIFASVGLAVEVKESLMDAVTGVSGSGPAYVFQFIEALSDGGVRCGLPRDVATKLAAQTVKGAAEMVLKTGKNPGVLKDGVTSPLGTTIAGIDALEQGGFRAATISAVKAATKRSLQLSGLPANAIENNYNL